MTYIWVRRSTTLLLTSLVLAWALQPVQRYSTPCWLFSRTTEPLERRPAQQQSTSNRDASSGSPPRTQNRRHSATRKTVKYKHFKTWMSKIRRKQAELNVPVFVEVSSRLPLWMTRPPWKSCRKQGGSFPWGTTTLKEQHNKHKGCKKWQSWRRETENVHVTAAITQKCI